MKVWAPPTLHHSLLPVKVTAIEAVEPATRSQQIRSTILSRSDLTLFWDQLTARTPSIADDFIVVITTMILCVARKSARIDPLIPY